MLPSEISAQVVINEFLVGPNPEWVELYNDNVNADYLKSYWIDDDTNFNDDSGNSSKKSLSSINTSNATYPYVEFNSFLNNDGDYVALFDDSGNLIDSYQYTENPGSGSAIGRSPNQNGSFHLLMSATKGYENTAPKPTLTPVPTPTNSPTPTPEPTSTNTPTPRATKTPTPKPSVKSAKTTTKPTKEIGSENNGTDVEKSRAELSAANEKESDDDNDDSEKSLSVLPIILIVVGAVVVGVSIFLMVKKYKNGYNLKGEDENTDDKIEL